MVDQCARLSGQSPGNCAPCVDGCALIDRQPGDYFQTVCEARSTTCLTCNTPASDCCTSCVTGYGLAYDNGTGQPALCVPMTCGNGFREASDPCDDGNASECHYFSGDYRYTTDSEYDGTSDNCDACPSD